MPQAASVVLAEDREHREDEVGLRERYPARVDAQEDLGDALLVDLVSDLDGEERIVRECAQTAERAAQLLLLAVVERLRPRAPQPLNELLDDLPVFLGPELSDVREELRVLPNRCVRDLEAPVTGAKAMVIVPLLKSEKVTSAPFMTA